MSFHVHFYRQNLPVLTLDDLELFCEKVGTHKLQIVDDTVAYRHPDTGIHFDFSRQAAPVQAASTFDNGWTYAGLSAEIPLCRATIYGAEAVPIIVILAKGFKMRIVHSGMAENAAPIDPSQESLMESWIVANHAALDAQGNAKMYEWKHEEMAQWYAYQLMRSKLMDQLEERGHESVEVPSIQLCVDTKHDNAVRTRFYWENGGGTVFPNSDFVAVSRKRKKLLGLKQSHETGWISTDQAKAAVATGLQPVQTEIGNIHMLNESMAVKLADRLDMLTLDTDLDRYKPITVDQIVDV
ncbi:MAG: hypothetical protein AB7N71_02885 [Phycisphaerae bacterium]